MARNSAPMKSRAGRSMALKMRSGMLVGPGLLKNWRPRITAIDDPPKIDTRAIPPRNGGESSKPGTARARAKIKTLPRCRRMAVARRSRNRPAASRRVVKTPLTMISHRRVMSAPDILLVDDDQAILDLG